MKKTLLQFRPGPLLLYGLGVAAMLLAGVYAAGYTRAWLSEARSSSVAATWIHSYSDLAAMEETADVIVLAEVVDVKPGRVAGSEVDQLRFTNVHLRVLEDWSREPLSSDEVVVELTGGDGTPFLSGNPPYRRGEVYALFLIQQSAEPFLYITGNPPQARYLVRDQRLHAMTDHHASRLTREWDGRTVQEMKQAVLDNRKASP
jgi:hypothetical protein